MWPVLVMYLAVSKVVHHSSPCCSGIDHYYCLPRSVVNEASLSNNRAVSSKSWIATGSAPIDWEFELIGRTNRNYMDVISDVGAFSVEDHQNEHVNEVLNAPLAGDTVVRVDHYTQLIPESLINTDDEITHVEADNRYSDDIGGSW